MSSEQAELVYKFEKDKNYYSEKYYFSAWEEWDYELSAFRKILDTEQFNIFGQSIKDAVDNYQQSLVEQDTKNLNELAFHKETIKYYKEQFLPDFFKDPVLYTFHWLSADKAKIDYLKTEYKKFLDESKKRILIDHFRNYRTFQPNQLEVSLLRHQIAYLWPDYAAFKAQMDQPTKAIADYLKHKLSYFIEKHEGFIVSKLDALNIFSNENFDSYHAKDRGGWHTVIIKQTSPDEQREYNAMCLLLLDRGQYDY